MNEQTKFFLHDQQPPVSQSPPIATPQRRTWSQQPQPPPLVGEPGHPEMRTWNRQPGGVSGGGFVLHDTTDR